MAIPASRIVSIEPRTIAGGSSNLECNGLLLDKNAAISASAMVMSFSSASAVGAWFGTDSLEYETASIYFTSYDGKFSAPKAFLIARRIDEDCAAWIRSASMGRTLADCKAVTDGFLTLTADGSEIYVSGVDFSEATSLSDVGAILGGALGLSCTYSSLFKAFTIESASTGEDSTIEWPAAAEEGIEGTDLAAFFGFREADGAVLSQGMNALDCEGQMAAVRGVSENWFSFTTSWAVDADEALEWASWASRSFGWLYVPYTLEPTAVSMDSSADLASRIKDAGCDHTAVVYGSLAYAAFMMGCCASVPWERTNGTITLAFKAQSGLAALVTDETEADVLESKRCSYYGSWATRNADFAFLYPGTLAASDYGYVDAYLNAVWLTARMQVAIMDGLKATPRVPYTDRGYGMIRAWLADPVAEAKANGAIEAGVTLSEAQKSELFNEAGVDVSSELWTQGYYIQVSDPGASVRAERGSPIVSLWYCYGGAVQRVEVASTVLL